MALRVFQFSASIPANTPKSALHTATLSLDNWDIERMDIEVPPGPGGLVGFYIANNGIQWMPQGAGQFIVWDDRQDSWYFTDQPDASGWAIVGYNLDTQYAHNIIIRFHVNQPTVPVQAPPAVTFVSTPTTQQPVTL